MSRSGTTVDKVRDHHRDVVVGVNMRNSIALEIGAECFEVLLSW